VNGKLNLLMNLFKTTLLTPSLSRNKFKIKMNSYTIKKIPLQRATSH
jgi:hypothetical protein